MENKKKYSKIALSTVGGALALATTMQPAISLAQQEAKENNSGVTTVSGEDFFGENFKELLGSYASENTEYEVEYRNFDEVFRVVHEGEYVRYPYVGGVKQELLNSNEGAVLIAEKEFDAMVENGGTFGRDTRPHEAALVVDGRAVFLDGLDNGHPQYLNPFYPHLSTSYEHPDKYIVIRGVGLGAGDPFTRNMYYSDMFSDSEGILKCENVPEYRKQGDDEDYYYTYLYPGNLPGHWCQYIITETPPPNDISTSTPTPTTTTTTETTPSDDPDQPEPTTTDPVTPKPSWTGSTDTPDEPAPSPTTTTRTTTEGTVETNVEENSRTTTRTTSVEENSTTSRQVFNEDKGESGDYTKTPGPKVNTGGKSSGESILDRILNSLKGLG